MDRGLGLTPRLVNVSEFGKSGPVGRVALAGALMDVLDHPTVRRASTITNLQQFGSSRRSVMAT